MSLFQLARPLLFKVDPETAHGMTLKALKSGLMPSCPVASSAKNLEKTVFGLNFPNPVGLAAGFDKNAEVIGPMLRMGFGFVEVGTVTPKPQAGNPRPRIFREPMHDAVINRMGFPNDGLTAFQRNITQFLSKPDRPKGIIGINIGMNKDQTEPVKDYALLIDRLGDKADYLTVNISSPNTPGLRDLQNPAFLAPFLETLLEQREKSCAGTPLLLKLAPDLDATQRAAIAKVVSDSGIDGLILGNTTLERPDFLPQPFQEQKGGLSGQPLKAKSTALVKEFYDLTGGKLPIIGVGGIQSAADAKEKFDVGASLVQLYSGLVFKGPGLPSEICENL